MKIHKNMTMEEYRQQPGLSKHQLDAFSVCPAYYKFKQTQEWKPSRAMELGTLAHSHILEGRVEYALGPSVDRRTTAGKDTWKKFCEDNIGKTVVNAEEHAQLLGVYDSAKKMLDRFPVADWDWLVESSMFWERDGVVCKGRPDLIALLDDKYTIVDLKTTTGIQYWDSKFFSLRYNVQAEWYCRGADAVLGQKTQFAFLVVDFDAPHLCQIVQMDDALMQKTTTLVNAELAKFRECLEKDEWPGLPERRIIASR
jgi:PDDEXK-like domain of unknown function (DUF3799)